MTSSDESEGELEELEEKKKSLEIRMKLLDEKIKAKRNKKQAQISENHTTCSNQNAQLSTFQLSKEDDVTFSWDNTFLEEMPDVDNSEDENFMSPEKNDTRHIRKQEKKAEKQSKIEMKTNGAYKRTRSQCDIAGPLYEIKVSALLYVRGIRKKLKKFLLATSVEAAELYDDIRFAYETESGKKKQMLVQLKHKDKRSISRTLLLAKKESNHGFSLQGCYESFCNLQEKFETNEVLNKFSRFSDIDFVLCTNAPAISSDRTFNDAYLCTPGENILDMYGKVFSFVQNRELIEDFKNTHRITDDDKVNKFFKHFYLYSNQKSEQDLDEEIMKEIKVLYNVSDYGADKHFMELVKKIQDWWRDRTLTRMPLHGGEFSCKSGPEILSDLSVELEKLKFEDIIVTKIKDVLSTDVNIVNCVTDIDNCEPSCDILLQSFRERSTQSLTIRLEDVVSCREDILCVWPSEWCPYLSVYDNEMQIPKKSIINTSVTVKESLNNYKFAKLFLISKNGKLLEKLYLDQPNISCKEVNITCEMSHLAKESKEQVLNRIVSIQGSEVTVQSVLRRNCDQAIDAQLLSLLTYSDKIIQLGCMKDERIKFYIDRVVTHNSFVSSSILMSKSRDIIAVCGITADQIHTLSKNDGSKLESKNQVLLQILYPQVNMIDWYSDGSLIDSTLVSSSFVVKTSWKQIKEISLDSKYSTHSHVSGNSDTIITSELKNVHIINSPKDFSKLCKRYKNKNVHWLSVENEKLKWIKSRGNLNTIIRNLSQDKESFPVNNVWDISDRIVILTGDSGIGKTSLLRQVALNSKTKKPETIVIQINLIDCLADLENLDLIISEEKACEFLIKNGILFGRTFQNSHMTFFKYILTKTNSAVLLVDGFDEVSFENEEKILNLIQSFCKLCILKLWIASRSNMTSKLERILSSVSFELRPLNMEEHEKLVNHLLNKSKQIKFYKSEIMPNDYDSQLLGSPLHCKMIAEIINNNEFTENDSLTGKNGFGSMTFIEAVVETKFKIYCKKYLHFISENKQTEDVIETKKKQFIENHQMSALLHIVSLPVSYKKEIIKQLNDFIKVVNNGAEKTGIISTFHGKTPNFEHKIYQEYFLALWLAQHCDGGDLEIARNILNIIIFDPQFSCVIRFFNELLISKCNKLILHEAIITYDWSTENLPKILFHDEVPQINLRDKAGRTPLHLALSFWNSNRNDVKLQLLTLSKQMAMIANLIELGANLTQKDKILKWSPFRYSNIQTVPWNIVALMLECGGIVERDKQELIERVNKNKNDSLAAFADGTSTESTALLSFLLNTCVCVDDSINDKGDTALIVAAGLGKSKILEYLHSEWHADPEKQNKNGDTPLHWACLKGHMPIVTYLIAKCKVSPETKNHTGYTPLLAAARGGQLEIVRHLVEIHRCSFQEKTNIGQSALHVAAAYAEDNIRLVAYLVKNRDLDIEECDNFGKKPVTAAFFAGNINIVEFFVSRCRFSLSKELINGLSLLHLVIICLHPGVVKHFIDSFQPSLDVIDREGHTLFMWATIRSHEEVCEYLKNEGANVEALSKEGNSALHFYVNKCHLVEIARVQWLVENCRIDPNLVNNDGLTALHCAIARSENPATRDCVQKSVLEYLKEKTVIK